MYRKENISARTKPRQTKEECFNRNIPILNILFYIGGGFMLKKQLLSLARIFYRINEHKANDMTADLLSCGLLVKKQATDTQTRIYIMTKFPLAMYHECNTRDSCSIKLNNRKIWNNIYRTEFIIRQVVLFMEQHSIELTLENLLNFLTDHCISIFTTENQMSVYQLYGNLFWRFPIFYTGSILTIFIVQISLYIPDYLNVARNAPFKARNLFLSKSSPNYWSPNY